MKTETNNEEGFSTTQKEYLSGFLAGVAQRPFVGVDPAGLLTSDPGRSTTPNLAAPEESTEETWYGVPIDELSKPEQTKRTENPLDIYDRMVRLAKEDQFPEGGDIFRFKFHGLFHVAPAQDALMMRCRIPANELNTHQFRGLASLAEQWGGDYADITTRGNLQVREIRPKDTINCLVTMQELGLTTRGAGADNVRNITVTPTSGFDPQELIDARPFAKGLHHYILNHRDLYGLPRKFNVAFDTGGSISVVSDTNDIGFQAVEVQEGYSLEPGVYFRLLLGGITGHRRFAQTTELLVAPDDTVAVSAAILRVFNEIGDRSNRNRARLPYAIDRIGFDTFLEKVEKELAFPINRVAENACRERHPVVRHGHIGIYKQKDRDLNYIGITVPAARMRVKTMRRIADIADRYGSGTVRLTVYQNLILPDIPNDYLKKAKRAIHRTEFTYSASAVTGGIVACTGNNGCPYSFTDTKGHSQKLARHLNSKVTLEQPVNIHLTGCPNSCAQHYIGDIGLLGAKVTSGSGEKVEGYHIAVGGGSDNNQAIGRDLYANIPFYEVPGLIEKMLHTYNRHKERGESFAEFTRRHKIGELQELIENS